MCACCWAILFERCSPAVWCLVVKVVIRHTDSFFYFGTNFNEKMNKPLFSRNEKVVIQESWQMISFRKSCCGDAAGTDPVHILPCGYQLSDPVSSLNSPPRKHRGRQGEPPHVWCRHDKHAADWVHNPGFRSSCSGCHSVWGAGTVQIPLSPSLSLCLSLFLSFPLTDQLIKSNLGFP